MDQDADLPLYVTDAIQGYLVMQRHVSALRGQGVAIAPLPFAGETVEEVARAHAASSEPLPLYDAMHEAVRAARSDPAFVRAARSARRAAWWPWSKRLPAPPPPAETLRRARGSERRPQYAEQLAEFLPGLHDRADPLGVTIAFLRRTASAADDTAVAALFAADARAGLMLADAALAGRDLGALAPCVLASAIEMFHQGRDFTSVLAFAERYLGGHAAADPRTARVLDRGWFAALRLGERARTLAILDQWLTLFPGDKRALHCKAVTHGDQPEIALRLLEQAGAARGDAPLPSIALFAEFGGRIGQLRQGLAALDAAPPEPELAFARHNLQVRLESAEDSARSAFAAQGLDLRWARLAVGEIEDRTPPRASSATLVTVVMTAYQAEPYLETAARSVLGQSHCAIELLIVDDASTDGTAAIAGRLAAADPRVRLLRNDRNIGTYVSKNRALRQARGRFAALCDADDMWLVNHVAEHLAVMEAEPELAVTTSDWLRLTEDGLIECGIGGRHIGLCPHSTFFAIDAFAAIGYFDSVRFGADAEMLHRARLHFGAKRVRHIPKILSLGRRHDASLTTSGVSRGGPLAETPLRRDYARDWNAWHFNGLRRGVLPVTQGTEDDRPFAVAQEMRA